jgi:hypothetical protein
MSGPFDYVNAISASKKDIIRESANPELEAKEYLPWITNKTLSYFPDTIMYCNEMNKYSFLSNQMQFDYLLNSVSKKKRFTKQSKKNINTDVQMIADYFGYSLRRAEDTIKYLTKAQIDEIKQKTDTGGV